MKRFSGFSAALLIVFMSHMLWAQERGGQPHGGAPQGGMGHEQGVGGGHIPQRGPAPVIAAPAPPKQASPPQGEQKHQEDIDREILRLTTQPDTTHFFSNGQGRK